MHIRIVLVASLSTVIIAQIDGEGAGGDQSFIDLDFPTVSAVSALNTALPGSVRSALSDPAFIESFVSDIAAGSTASWLNALPPELKSILNTNGPVEDPTGDSTISPSVSSSSAIETSPNESESTTEASAESSAEPSEETPSEGNPDPSSSQEAGAPGPTGALTAGLIGAAGVLALAIGL